MTDLYSTSFTQLYKKLTQGIQVNSVERLHNQCLDAGVVEVTGAYPGTTNRHYRLYQLRTPGKLAPSTPESTKQSAFSPTPILWQSKSHSAAEIKFLLCQHKLLCEISPNNGDASPRG